MATLPSPDSVGIRCRHRRKTTRSRGLCAGCDRRYFAIVAPARVARARRAREAKARALYRARVVALRRRLADRSLWRRRDAVLRRVYGISVFQYNELWKRQRGRCAVCERELAAPYVDHDHRTGRVRGILCYRCNRGIGMFRDLAGSLSRAAEYVESGFDARAIVCASVADAVFRRWEGRR